jgi:hypothetical protein
MNLANYEIKQYISEYSIPEMDVNRPTGDYARWLRMFRPRQP